MNVWHSVSNIWEEFMGFHIDCIGVDGKFKELIGTLGILGFHVDLIGMCRIFP